MLSFKDRGAGQINTVATHRVVDLKVISFADLEVLKTVRRCGVHATCTRISRHVVAQHQRYGLACKRRHNHDAIEHLTFDGGSNVHLFHTKTRSTVRR